MARLHRLDTSGLRGTTEGYTALAAGVRGMAAGVERRREHDQQQARLMLAQQEMALRQKALQHGLDREEQVTQWSQKLGEYEAWRAGSDDETQPQGPTPEGGSLPSQPNQPAIDAKLMELARTIPDARTREAFVDTVAHEQKTRAVTRSRDSLVGELRNRRLQKGYRSSTIDGEEDPAGEELAADWEKQLSELDPNEDPEAAAALVDKIQSGDLQYRAGLAQHNFQIKQRAKKEMDLETAIQQRESVPGVNTDEARQVQELWKSGLIDDKQLGAMMPDALNGQLALKMQTAKLAQENEQLKMELTRRSMQGGGDAGLSRTRQLPSPPQYDLGGPRRATPGSNGNGKAESPLQTEGRIVDILKKEYPEGAKDDATRVSIEKRRAELKTTARGPDSKDQIVQDIRSGNLTGSEARARAKALGLSFEELQAALGQK